jgi:hypothetical protein
MVSILYIYLCPVVLCKFYMQHRFNMFSVKVHLMISIIIKLLPLLAALYLVINQVSKYA